MKVLTSIFVAFAMFLSLGISANAQLEIYGIGSFSGIAIPCDPFCEEPFETDQIGFIGESTLYKISPNTGQANFVGFTGFGTCRGLDIHPLTEELYAVCNKFDIREIPLREEGEGQVLVHIDKNTGEGTEIGPLGDGIGSFLKGAGFISDISFDHNGVLYAHLNNVGPIYMPFPGNKDEKTSNGILENTLGTIDLLTGAFQPIGPTGSNDFSSAIGFSNIGDLIQCANFNNLRRAMAQETNEVLIPSYTNINSLNQNTGMATFIRQAIFPPSVNGHINAITSKDVDDNTGVFYGFLRTEFDNWIFDDLDAKNIDNGSYLVRINPDTGQVEIVGPTGPIFEDFLAIAVRNVTRNVPTMSEYGLMATAVLLLGAAAIYLRRRQAKLEA